MHVHKAFRAGFAVIVLGCDLRLSDGMLLSAIPPQPTIAAIAA
jgi:hypothetical protein